MVFLLVGRPRKTDFASYEFLVYSCPGLHRATSEKHIRVLLFDSPQNQIRIRRTHIMEKYIFDKNNGLWYELQGDYFIPCLVLEEVDTQPIGMWGRKHLRYIKEHRPTLYTDLLTSGKLSSYLAEVDNRASTLVSRWCVEAEAAHPFCRGLPKVQADYCGLSGILIRTYGCSYQTEPYMQP